MAFLDNSGDIILDAVLTDLGRKRLAAGNFRISKFALGDEEVNYNLFDPSDSRGSAFYDLEIMQTPVLEAFTSDQSLMKTRLLSFARNNLLYMPILKINDKEANVGCRPDPAVQGFHLISDNYTLTNNNRDNNTAVNTGFINGLLDASAVTTHVCIDQGIDSSDDGLNIGQDLDPALLETAFIVKVDHRLLRLQAYTGTNSYRTLTNQFIDDDSIATYYVIQGQEGSPILGPRSDAAGRRRKEISPNSTELSDIGNSHEMFAGPLGNILRIVPRVSNSVQQSTSLFTELGSAGTSLSFRGGDLGNHKFIDTLMSITGITTGYSIDVPIRIVKKD